MGEGASGVAVEVVEQPVKALAVIGGQLICDRLKLRIAEAGSIKCCLLAGDKFMLHLIAQYGQAFAQKCGILILHQLHSLSVGRV